MREEKEKENERGEGREGKKRARATLESCTQTNHKIPTEATKPG